MNPLRKIEATMEAAQTELHPIVEHDLDRQRVHPEKSSRMTDPALETPIASIHQSSTTPHLTIQLRVGKQVEPEPKLLNLAGQTG